MGVTCVAHSHVFHNPSCAACALLGMKPCLAYQSHRPYSHTCWHQHRAHTPAAAAAAVDLQLRTPSSWHPSLQHSKRSGAARSQSSSGSRCMGSSQHRWMPCPLSSCALQTVPLYHGVGHSRLWHPDDVIRGGPGLAALRASGDLSDRPASQGPACGYKRPLVNWTSFWHVVWTFLRRFPWCVL
jgi:hypothetical protein